jgi:hypothetical protein
MGISLRCLNDFSDEFIGVFEFPVDDGLVGLRVYVIEIFGFPLRRKPNGAVGFLSGLLLVAVWVLFLD